MYENPVSGRDPETKEETFILLTRPFGNSREGLRDPPTLYLQVLWGDVSLPSFLLLPFFVPSWLREWTKEKREKNWVVFLDLRTRRREHRTLHLRLRSRPVLVGLEETWHSTDIQPVSSLWHHSPSSRKNTGRGVSWRVQIPSPSVHLTTRSRRKGGGVSSTLTWSDWTGDRGRSRPPTLAPRRNYLPNQNRPT